MVTALAVLLSLIALGDAQKTCSGVVSYKLRIYLGRLVYDLKLRNLQLPSYLFVVTHTEHDVLFNASRPLSRESRNLLENDANVIHNIESVRKKYRSHTLWPRNWQFTHIDSLLQDLVIDVDADRNATWVSFLGIVRGDSNILDTSNIFYSVTGIPLCRAGTFIYHQPNMNNSNTYAFSNTDAGGGHTIVRILDNNFALFNLNLIRDVPPAFLRASISTNQSKATSQSATHCLFSKYWKVLIVVGVLAFIVIARTVFILACSFVNDKRANSEKEETRAAALNAQPIYGTVDSP